MSSTDLLKNYIFSILDTNSENKHLLDNFEEKWDKITKDLQNEKFPDFLRTYWNSKYKLTKHADLFKSIRANIQNIEQVFSLFRELEKDLDNYLALISPETSDWSQDDKLLVNNLKLFKVRLPYSLLLAAKRKLNEADFSKLLKAIKNITFRYNTIAQRSPAEQETVYNNIAVRISNNSIQNLNDIWPLLRQIYIDDRRFTEDFSVRVFKSSDSRTKKIVKYILCEIEQHISNNTPLDFQSNLFNIEHILPVNAEDDWDIFSEAEKSALVYRLGNMTLMNSNQNRDLGNSSYPIKKETYLNSNFHLTKNLANEYNEWTPQSIESWQRYLANQAKTIWRVSQIHQLI